MLVSLFAMFLLGKSVWELIFEQFDDLLVKILLLAAVISFVSKSSDFNDSVLQLLFPSDLLDSDLHLTTLWTTHLQYFSFEAGHFWPA